MRMAGVVYALLPRIEGMSIIWNHLGILIGAGLTLMAVAVIGAAWDFARKRRGPRPRPRA
jgi:hypothetical protein